MGGSVKEVYGKTFSFAALREDGSVVSWGHRNDGGDSSRVASELRDVIDIVSNHFAYAALKKDGSVVCFGLPNSGGVSPPELLRPKAGKLVDKIMRLTDRAFAALLEDGSVVTWGHGTSAASCPCRCLRSCCATPGLL